MTSCCVDARMLPRFMHRWMHHGVAVVVVSLVVACGGGGSDAVAPSIGAQPASVVAIEGQPASFSVGVGGSAPLVFQWRRNGVDVAGANSASYATPAVAPADNGVQFNVVVSNSVGSVTSAVATLTTRPAIAPSIVTPPADVSVVVGMSAVFTVVATGSDPLEYQWYRNGVAITDADSARHETAETTLADNGAAFAVVVSNAGGSATSAAARLGVTPTALAPSFATQRVTSARPGPCGLGPAPRTCPTSALAAPSASTATPSAPLTRWAAGGRRTRTPSAPTGS